MFRLRNTRYKHLLLGNGLLLIVNLALIAAWHGIPNGSCAASVYGTLNGIPVRFTLATSSLTVTQAASHLARDP